MKACGRAKNGVKCGILFEGQGSYCRNCRNDYQKEYYARRKAPYYKSVQESLGSSCQACSVGLRSNTIAIIDTPGLETNVTLCATCKAVVTYLSETVEEAAQEFLVDLAMELAALKFSSSPRPVTTPTASVYVPQPALGDSSTHTSTTTCGYCNEPAVEGKEYCKKHSYFEEAIAETAAAKLERGEL